MTLEQARTLVALADSGSYAKAAQALNKVHSAVIYSVAQLEQTLEVKLFDRSGYRAQLTPMGETVLERCRGLLQGVDEIQHLCALARSGVEANVKIVFDGLIPPEPILEAAAYAKDRDGVTRISLFSEFLTDVESRFSEESADIMISVVPPSKPMPMMQPLKPMPSVLVAHHQHPLAQPRRPLTLTELNQHTFLTVRGSDERLGLSTTDLDRASVFRLSDFHAKKAALQAKMGFGWMPEYLLESELRRQKFKVLNWGESRGRHVFRPMLYWRGTGVVASRFAQRLREKWS